MMLTSTSVFERKMRFISLFDVVNDSTIMLKVKYVAMSGVNMTDRVCSMV